MDWSQSLILLRSPWLTPLHAGGRNWSHCQLLCNWYVRKSWSSRVQRLTRLLHIQIVDYICHQSTRRRRGPPCLTPKPTPSPSLDSLQFVSLLRPGGDACSLRWLIVWCHRSSELVFQSRSTPEIRRTSDERQAHPPWPLWLWRWQPIENLIELQMLLNVLSQPKAVLPRSDLKGFQTLSVDIQ